MYYVDGYEFFNNIVVSNSITGTFIVLPTAKHTALFYIAYSKRYEIALTILMGMCIYSVQFRFEENNASAFYDTYLANRHNEY